MAELSGFGSNRRKTSAVPFFFFFSLVHQFCLTLIYIYLVNYFTQMLCLL